MDIAIKELKYTDDATKQTLENVRKKKKKFDRFKKWHFNLFYLTSILTLAFMIYFYNQIASHSSSYLSLFSLFLKDGISVGWFFTIFVTFSSMSMLKKEKEKLEKEYHEMRCEIVDKSKDLWKQEEHWKNRHLAFALMKEKYDINLYNAKK